MDDSFRFVALPSALFEPWFSKSDAELAALGARWTVVDANPGYPCRVSLIDAEVGETVLAIPFTHHDVQSPYRASGPIFVRPGARTARPDVDEIPALLRRRLLSVRAYDAAAMMIGAEVVRGTELEPVIRQMMRNEAVRYLHVHNAGPGCYNCSVLRGGAGAREVAP
jgi:hypothetical protein